MCQRDLVQIMHLLSVKMHRHRQCAWTFSSCPNDTARVYFNQQAGKGVKGWVLLLFSHSCKWHGEVLVSHRTSLFTQPTNLQRCILLCAKEINQTSLVPDLSLLLIKITKSGQSMDIQVKYSLNAIFVRLKPAYILKSNKGNRIGLCETKLKFCDMFMQDPWMQMMSWAEYMTEERT